MGELESVAKRIPHYAGLNLLLRADIVTKE